MNPSLMQSAMLPHGTQAAEIARLAWILFIGGTVILAAVCICLWLAMRGTRRQRTIVSDPRAVLIGGIAAPLVVLTSLLAYNVVMMRNAETRPSDQLRIEVSGEQWWWRVSYLNGDARKFATANEIHIPVGREVEFSLVSPDVIHSFWVPALGGKADMIPGRTVKLRLKADRPGVFRGQCAEYCGGPHALMALPVVALPAAEFDAWQTREAAPAPDVSGDAERKGQTLFSAAGCGSCHAVRGTQAAGNIGPDLTHFGARRSVGIDTLPVTKENVSRFITDNQHIKPGVLMPQFRIFSSEDLDALSSYLLALK